VRLEVESEDMVQKGQFERAADLRDQAEELRKKGKQLAHQWAAKPEGERPVLDEEAIVRGLSSSTGIPADEIRARDNSSVEEHNRPADEGVPQFEKSQCESVLHGDSVTVVPNTGFVLIPHNDEFLGIYEDAIRPAMETNGIEAKIAADIYEPGSILGQVWNHIRTAEVIVADVSGTNPNVIYELGLCFGLRRCPIILTRKSEELPFNLRVLRYLQYENSAGGSKALREALTAAIQEFLAAARSAMAEVSPPGRRRVRPREPVATVTQPTHPVRIHRVEPPAQKGEAPNGERRST
jgi:hypothetical protein